MSRSAKGGLAIAAGVFMIVAGVFAWLGDVSVTLAGVGLIVLLVGAGTLLSTQSRSNVSNPHPAVYAILVIAIAVHAYHHLTSESSPGFFAWALVPYAVALTIACFRGARIAVAAGAALALALDVWTYYVVAHPTSSTAGLALLWMPLWNAIIVVPAATFVAWLLIRKIPALRANEN